MLNFSQNRLFIIAGAFIVAVFILITIVFLSRGFGPADSGPLKELKFWGVFDDTNDFRSTLNTFQQRYPRIRISYQQFNYEDYEKELIEAFAAGRGPDIWMIQNTWLPKQQEKITPLPQQKLPGQEKPLFTLRDFRDQFVDVAEKDLVVQEQIYGLPLYVDTLALYYNKDIFNSVGIASPPETWEEFNGAVEKIATIGENEAIIRAGAAIGTAKNINRSTDILSLLMMQSGVPMSDPESGAADFLKEVNGRNPGQTALEYYTDFANPTKRVYTWNSSAFYSIDAFQQGAAAMMFNYAHQIEVLKARAPRLNFGVAPMPQLNLDRPVNYANYWAATVSKFSASPVEAWQFATYLTSFEGAIPYLNSTEHPTARRDLIDQQKEDLTIGVFVKQVLTADSWYQVDSAAIENILATMIEDVNFRRRSIVEALNAAESQINVLVQRR